MTALTRGNRAGDTDAVTADMFVYIIARTLNAAKLNLSAEYRRYMARR